MLDSALIRPANDAIASSYAQAGRKEQESIFAPKSMPFPVHVAGAPALGLRRVFVTFFLASG